MVIDCNALFGFEQQYNKDLSLEKLLEIMDNKKIDKALITNMQCKYFDFIEGNNETADIVKKIPGRFIGMFSLNIAQFIDVEKEVDRCINELNLSVFRVFNTDSNFTAGWGSSFASLTMYKILEKLSQSYTPVFIEGGYSFKDILELSKKFSKLPIIASGIGYGNMGEAILAAKEAQNLYLEISTLDAFNGIDLLVEYLGSEKIIFGTGIPYNTPSPEMLMINSSSISKEEKENIFSNNILRILDSRRVK